MERELRIEGDETIGYYTKRYIVKNGDRIGSYGVFFKPGPNWTTVPYGATRDYHEIAPADAAERYERYRTWLYADDDDESPMPDNCLNLQPQPCEYHDKKLCICDGSSLVEVITDDERAFAIAEMMAQ